MRSDLRELAGAEADPCDPTPGWSVSGEHERKTFEDAFSLIESVLNDGSLKGSADERVTDVLRSIEVESGSINERWPDENRFHFKVVSLAPVLAVSISVRTNARLQVFGRVPPGDGGRTSWQSFGDPGADGQQQTRSWLELFPLHRGPSGFPRLLVKRGYTGCAGSSGLKYYVYEWSHPESRGANLETVLSKEGALGLDQQEAFPPAGRLRTAGSVISLPYCWWSPIDFWDNPSMCSVDRFDVSGDFVQFVGTRTNRPELLPIAKVLGFAAKNDLLAVRGYCASDRVAKKLVFGRPSGSDASDPVVKRRGPGQLRVTLGGGSVFVVAKRTTGWVIVSFQE